jgi:hypothetical protein
VKIKHLSKQDMVLLLEMIHESLACVSEDEIRNVMSRLSGLIPYRAALSCISKINANGIIESMQVVNVDYPAEYLVELGKRANHRPLMQTCTIFMYPRSSLPWTCQAR